MLLVAWCCWGEQGPCWITLGSPDRDRALFVLQLPCPGGLKRARTVRGLCFHQVRSVLSTAHWSQLILSFDHPSWNNMQMRKKKKNKKLSSHNLSIIGYQQNQHGLPKEGRVPTVAVQAEGKCHRYSETWDWGPCNHGLKTQRTCEKWTRGTVLSQPHKKLPGVSLAMSSKFSCRC